MWVVTWITRSLWCHQHHRDFRGAGKVGQHFGVSGERVPPCPQRLLVERGGAERVDLARFDHRHSPFDEAEGRISGNRRKLAPRQPFGDEPEIDAIDAPALEGGLPH